jgi:hypothetical protein
MLSKKTNFEKDKSELPAHQIDKFRLRPTETHASVKNQEIAINPTLRQFTKSPNIENAQTKRKSHFLPAFCIKSAKPETEQSYKHQQTHNRKNAMRLEKYNRIH